MTSRFIWWHAAAELVAVIATAAACGTAPQRAAPVEDPSALVIPPLASDAGGVAGDPEPAEPEVRAGLAIRARDPRFAARQPRSRALILTEVKQLERLIQATQSPLDRPRLRHRLAALFAELAYTASGPHADRARDEAIKQYVMLKGEDPQFPQIDEIHYYLALAYELNGNLTEARRSYFELITKAPLSRLIPLGYFAFGELFFAEGKTDPSKNALAVQAYQEVLKYPPADNPVYADALARLGETHLRMQDDERATQMFDRLRHEFPDSDAARRIPSKP
jgi:TolA-binding protein